MQGLRRCPLARSGAPRAGGGHDPARRETAGEGTARSDFARDVEFRIVPVEGVLDDGEPQADSALCA